MSSQSGSGGRRRVAGDAARRRREAAARAASSVEGADAESAEEQASLESSVTRPESDAEATDRPSDPTTESTGTPATGSASPPEAEEATAERGDPPDSEPEEPATASSQTRTRLSAPPREAWWWLALLGVVTVCALIFVAVVGFGYLSERNDDDALAEGREDAASTAATSAEEILSYDHSALGAEQSKAQELMTDDFAKEYGSLYSGKYCDVLPEGDCTEKGTFSEVVKQRKQTVEAAVVDVGPMECGDECSDTETTVLLFIDQSTTSDGENLQPVGTQAKFTMVKRDGEWLVDNIV